MPCLFEISCLLELACLFERSCLLDLPRLFERSCLIELSRLPDKKFVSVLASDLADDLEQKLFL